MSSSFVGGALSFKGDKKTRKSAKKKSKEVKHSLERGDQDVLLASVDGSDEMTDAERKAMKRRRDREQKELEKVAQMSHRERVEEFNEKLATQTEHNDIPRVSAAGNG